MNNRQLTKGLFPKLSPVIPASVYRDPFPGSQQVLAVRMLMLDLRHMIITAKQIHTYDIIMKSVMR